MMNKAIIHFIEKQKCATICCMDDLQPYSFSCFYVFDVEKSMLYFKSSADTKHIQLLQKNNLTAGTILPNKLHPLIVQGLQFQGKLMNDEEHKQTATKKYHTALPFALAFPGNVWAIELNFIKFTDSSNVFNKKIIWTKS